MLHGKGDYIKVIPLFYLLQFMVHHIQVSSHHQVVLLYTHLVVINPLIHHLGSLKLPQGKLEDPLMLVILMEEVVEASLEEVAILVGLVPLDPLQVVPLLGIGLEISLRQGHPSVIESIVMDNYLPSWYISRLSWATYLWQVHIT